MTLTKTLLGAALGVSAVALTAVNASAGVACAGPVCWHTTERYEYPRDSRVIVHEDSWRPEADAKITWREHPGRGYWHEDKWVDW